VWLTLRAAARKKRKRTLVERDRPNRDTAHDDAGRGVVDRCARCYHAQKRCKSSTLTQSIDGMARTT